NWFRGSEVQISFFPLVLQILHIQNLVLLDAAGSLDLGDIAGIFANQCARYGRADRNLVVLDVRLVVADDLVGNGFAAVDFFQIHRGTEYAATVGVEVGGIDDLGIGELAFHFDNATLDETLPFLGSIVFGILGQVAVRTRLLDGGDD